MSPSGQSTMPRFFRENSTNSESGRSLLTEALRDGSLEGSMRGGQSMRALQVPGISILEEVANQIENMDLRSSVPEERAGRALQGYPPPSGRITTTGTGTTPLTDRRNLSRSSLAEWGRRRQGSRSFDMTIPEGDSAAGACFRDGTGGRLTAIGGTS